jgi:hypothetical protein
VTGVVDYAYGFESSKIFPSRRYIVDKSFDYFDGDLSTEYFKIFRHVSSSASCNTNISLVSSGACLSLRSIVLLLNR